MKEPFYITTSIFYASGKPHIGNTYESILTDSIARYKRIMGYDVKFQTGTDEHGEKVQQKALEAGQSPQEFVDDKALEVRRIDDLLNISYDNFVRTTNPHHEEVVQKIFQKLYDQGDIYKGHYEGWYCTPCESFFTETDVIDGKCPDCGREVHKTKEEAYFLKLSKYNKWLEEYIETHPHFIEPESRKNEIVNNFIKPGVQDLCISRTSFDWGIKVPRDPKHVIYVWLDALVNYITFIGYDIDESTDEFKKYWPADVQIIGKDILRFHTIYWPVILKALDLPLPKKIFGHPWVLASDSDKMSKSKGNVLYADDLVKLFGVDAVRYYCLHEIPFGHDGYIGYDLMIDRINADLANTLGNLVNRTISMSKKYFDGVVYKPNKFEEIDNDLINSAKTLGNRIEQKMNDLKVADAIDEIFELCRKSNKYIDDTTPWILAKDETKKERLQTVLYNLLETIRISSVYLSAFLPDTADEIFKQLNTQNRSISSTKTFDGMDTGIILNEPKILFARIDKKEFAKKIEA
jgi:methionyl-tRNA synthetase